MHNYKKKLYEKCSTLFLREKYPPEEILRMPYFTNTVLVHYFVTINISPNFKVNNVHNNDNGLNDYL